MKGSRLKRDEWQEIKNHLEVGILDQIDIANAFHRSEWLVRKVKNSDSYEEYCGKDNGRLFANNKHQDEHTTHENMMNGSVLKQIKEEVETTFKRVRGYEDDLIIVIRSPEDFKESNAKEDKDNEIPMHNLQSTLYSLASHVELEFDKVRKQLEYLERYIDRLSRRKKNV